MRPGFLPIAISAVLAAIAFAQSQSPIQLEPEKTFNRNLAAGGTDFTAVKSALREQNLLALTNLSAPESTLATNGGGETLEGGICQARSGSE